MNVNRTEIKPTTFYFSSLEKKSFLIDSNKCIFSIDTFFSSREINKPSNRLRVESTKFKLNYLIKESRKKTFILWF